MNLGSPGERRTLRHFRCRQVTSANFHVPIVLFAPLVGNAISCSSRLPLGANITQLSSEDPAVSAVALFALMKSRQPRLAALPDHSSPTPSFFSQLETFFNKSGK